MDELARADKEVKEIAQMVVARHRAAGFLTWALLHQLEAEVLEEASRSGQHKDTILNMLRAPEAMAYPRDQRVASFEGHGFVPIVFGDIVEAWNRVH